MPANEQISLSMASSPADIEPTRDLATGAYHESRFAHIPVSTVKVTKRIEITHTIHAGPYAHIDVVTWTYVR